MININSLAGTIQITGKRKIPKFGDSSSRSASFVKGPSCRGDARSIVRSVPCLLSYSGNTCSSQTRKRFRSIEDRIVRSIMSRFCNIHFPRIHVHIVHDDAKWKSVFLESILGKYFDFSRIFAKHFHPWVKIFSKSIL